MDFNGPVDGLALQQSVNDWYARLLLPQLEAALEQYGPDDRLVLDSLHIDVSVEYGNNWLPQLTQQIITRTKEQLAKQETIKTHGTANGQRTTAFLHVLIYFLQHGFLPWYSTIESRQQFWDNYHDWMAQLSQVEADELLTCLGANELAAQRFVSQFPAASFASLLATAGKTTESNWQLLLSDVEKVSQASGASDADTSLQHFKKWLLLHLSDNATELAIKKALEAWLKEMPIQGKAMTHIQHWQVKKAMQEREAASGNGKPALPHLLQGDTTNGQQQIASLQTPTDADTELEEGIFIPNAGSIILAPFLPTLFIHTGLLVNDWLEDKATAIGLLHFVVTGKEELAEFETPLYKILCGLPLTAPLVFARPLTQQQKDEADSLLQSVIQHWSILKNTSPEGLQQSFLQREGKLSHTPNGWHLQIATQPYDMLLQHLPWSISMVRLSWMKEVLRTEWQ